MDTRPGAAHGEAVAVWALWGAVLLALVVTYARLPVSELYRVDEGGFWGALGRALTLTNWPIAIVAAALVPVALDALPGRAWPVGVLAVALCATVAIPGVIDEHDLDARPVNVLPALGVLLSLGLTIAAVRRAGVRLAPRTRGDTVRAAVAAVVVLASLPWIFAELGFTLPEGVFLTERLGRDTDGSTIQAVHPGHHHGWDGALLLLSAMVLSRARLRARRLDRTLAVLVGTIGAYGLVIAVQDFWGEQVVKRGWLEWQIPEAIRPSGSWIWLVTLSLAVAASVALVRRRHEPLPSG